MENETEPEKNKKKEKIPDRTYSEIADENDYLGRRVVDLLEKLQIAEMENEKMKTKFLKMENENKSMTDFDEGWICDLIAERDEERKSKNIYIKQLEECKQKIKELEDERDTAKRRNTGDDNSTDQIVKEKSCVQIHGIMQMNEEKGNKETATDSGIDIQSLEKLTDERVAVKNHTGAVRKNSSNEFTQMVYTNAVALHNHKIRPATIDDIRELKNGPKKFRKISITGDYTQEE